MSYPNPVSGMFEALQPFCCRERVSRTVGPVVLRDGLGIFRRLSVGTCGPFSERVQAEGGTGGTGKEKGGK